MAQPFIQTSFNSGEWAPNTWSRVDLENYKSGAAVLENWFVDFRGGASTRSGSKFALRGYDDNKPIRMITFQASIGIGYALEFGEEYIRFFRGGAPVVTNPRNITGITQANPGVVTAVAHGYDDLDTVVISGVLGMTQVNAKYFLINVLTANTFQLLDMFGNNVDTSAYSAYTSGGVVRRVLKLDSPYAADDLALLKFTQNVNSMIFTHPDYTPQILEYTSETVWTLSDVEYGPTIGVPTGLSSSSTLGGGLFNYAYVVTAVDVNGQESNASVRTELNGFEALGTANGSNIIEWTKVTDAAYYRVYKAVLAYDTSIPAQPSYGYIGFTKSLRFVDTNIAADFSVSPPEPFNPFATGYKVESVTVTNQGNYAAGSTINVVFDAPSGGGVTATGVTENEIRALTIALAGTNYVVGDIVTISGTGGGQITVQAIGGAGEITGFSLDDRGAMTGSVPANTRPTTGGTGAGATFNATYRVASVTITNPGSGYQQPSDIPVVTFSAGTVRALGTAVLEIASLGNPGIVGFSQQRSVWGGLVDDPNTIFYSRPGQYYNFDNSTPTQPQDSIVAPIVSGQLANIKNFVQQSGGLVALTDGPNYLLNGGSLGAPIGPDSIVANAQSFIGANDVPPIVVNFDILYVQAVGSGVRASSYNFYANVFTGDDISMISSHLFFGYEILEWAWAQEPYKIVWAVRDDGVMLALTYIKEQKFVAWTHHATEGLFKSVCSVVEPATKGYQNFLYAVVERTIGGTAYRYIEYFPERPTSDDPADYWTVDSALRYDGAPETNFTGGEHLKGLTVTGLADGVVIPPFAMPSNGNFTLATAASKVTVGLGFSCQLQTLYIELQVPGGTIQSKMKKINGAALRVTNALGLKIGTEVATLQPIKDLVVGNVGSMTNEVVAGLVTGDVFGFLDPKWQEPGQIFIQQDLPFPATVLGYIPQVAPGDTVK